MKPKLNYNSHLHPKVIWLDISINEAIYKVLDFMKLQEDYDFDVEGNFEQKSYVKGKMRVKRYDKSFSRDKKGQSDMMKEGSSL